MHSQRLQRLPQLAWHLSVSLQQQQEDKELVEDEHDRANEHATVRRRCSFRRLAACCTCLLPALCVAVWQICVLRVGYHSKCKQGGLGGGHSCWSLERQKSGGGGGAAVAATGGAAGRWGGSPELVQKSGDQRIAVNKQQRLGGKAN